MSTLEHMTGAQMIERAQALKIIDDLSDADVRLLAKTYRAIIFDHNIEVARIRDGLLALKAQLLARRRDKAA